MERYSYRDHILLRLGHNSPPRRSFVNPDSSSPKTQSRNSDLDFSDVFGGPPRLSSVHELRHSLGDTPERGEAALASRSSWSVLSEKPVFGEESLVRRRYRTDDFFDDIFRGDESSSSTPRKPDRDPFSSSPASRILSPLRPLTSKTESFGLSSLPTQLSFSLPTKFAKGMDFPVYNTSTSRSPYRSKDGAQNAGFPSSPGAFSSRVSNQVMQGQDDLKNDAQPSYCQSPLSHAFSLSSEESSKATRIDSVAEDRIDSFRFNEKAASPKPVMKPPQSLGNITSEIPHSLTTQKEVKQTNPFSGVSGSSTEQGLHGGIKKEENVSMQEKRKAELKSLHSLFYENSDGQGKDGVVRQAEGREAKEGRVETIGTSSRNIVVRKRLEKQDKRKILDLASNRGLQGTGANSREKFSGNKVKGKVKELLKIFNQEAPPNHIINVGTQGNSSRRKEKDASEADDGALVSATKADGKENVTNLNTGKTLTNGEAMVDQTLKQREKSHFILNNSTNKTYDTSSGRTCNSASCPETIPASFEPPLVSVEESHHEDLQGGYLVKEASPNQNRQQTIEYREEVQISDSRIRQWSNGKETNIRALLSTLQYVLWPESGWKPVPLVNIIEGNSMKRAYQKALLCLHPDKLQQKGAAPQQRYIAEKVYGILQEAWTHFNSLSSF